MGRGSKPQGDAVIYWLKRPKFSAALMRLRLGVEGSAGGLRELDRGTIAPDEPGRLVSGRRPAAVPWPGRGLRVCSTEVQQQRRCSTRLSDPHHAAAVLSDTR